MAAEKKKPTLKGRPDASAATPSIGTSGLKQYSGYVREEFHRDLQGPRGVKAFTEMGANSAVVGSGLAVGRLIASLAEWKVEPFSEEDQDKAAAEFINSCRDDMEHSWASLIRSAFSMIQYGFAPHEIVLKVRDGVGSKHDDGLIGWKALPLRPQDSLKRWVFDDNGRWTAMVQQGQTDLKERTIPREKLLNFRPRDDKDNPEGISALRMVYFTYYWWKKIQEIEGILVERSGAGLPVMGIPASCVAEGNETFEMAKQIVQNLRTDSDAGVVLPLEYAEGQPLYTLNLLSATGSSLPDTSKIIERLDRRMAQALGTDFQLLGHEGVGSYNLGDSKLDSFEMAVTGYLCLIAEPINHVLIPLTLKVNGLDPQRPPRLCHQPLEKPDLARLGDFINKMISASVITADDPLEAHMREAANLPPHDPATKREKPAPPAPFGGGKPDDGMDKGKPPEMKPTKEESEAAGAAAAERAVLIAAATRAPEQPVVNVTVQPAAPAAVEVKVPEQPAPVVNVETAAPAITVQSAPVPERKRRSRKVKFVRDSSGAVVGADIKEEE
jgi:hypothetical protein